MSGPLVADATVVRAERLSPSFVRVELGGEALGELGVDGPWWDQRIKLVVPASRARSGGTPRAADLGVGPAGAPEDWYAAWCALPEERRGAMRTYSVRDVRGTGARSRLVVDIVLHPGAHGPGSAWAGATAPGDRVLLVAPRRGTAFGGIEFRPPSRGHMLVVADEAAVPAAASILEAWPDGLAGTAFLEVPGAGDVLPDVACPPGVEVCWLPRCESQGVGHRLVPAVGAWLGLERDPVPSATHAGVAAASDPPGEALAWETPALAGDTLQQPGVGGDGNLHAWVAGESDWVRQVRRMLVHERGVDRSRVAFMGYWRRGVAMRA